VHQSQSGYEHTGTKNCARRASRPKSADWLAFLNALGVASARARAATQHIASTSGGWWTPRIPDTYRNEGLYTPCRQRLGLAAQHHTRKLWGACSPQGLLRLGGKRAWSEKTTALNAGHREMGREASPTRTHRVAPSLRSRRRHSLAAAHSEEVVPA